MIPSTILVIADSKINVMSLTELQTPLLEEHGQRTL